MEYSRDLQYKVERGLRSRLTVFVFAIENIGVHLKVSPGLPSVRIGLKKLFASAERAGGGCAASEFIIYPEVVRLPRTLVFMAEFVIGSRQARILFSS